MSSPLDQALTQLGNTIEGITGKVDENKKRVQAYKAKVIAKIQEIYQQIEDLKSNNALNSIPDLKSRLAASQQQLQSKTDELDKTKADLATANNTLKQLQDEAIRLNQDIAQKTDEIKRLTDSNTQKDGQLSQKDQEIAQAKNDLDNLTAQKNQIQQQLDQSNAQISSLVNRIATINSALVKQIGFIDSIADELGDLDNNADSVASQFKAVSDNIMSVVNILNGSTPGPGPKLGRNTAMPPSFAGVDIMYNELIQSSPERLAKYYDTLAKSNKSDIAQIIKTNIDAAKQGSPDAQKNIKEALSRTSSNSKTGGYKRRKTNKLRNKRRKTYKKTYRGGYTYSPSLSKEHKEIDRKSTIISGSTSYKSKSASKTKSKSKTRKRF